MRVQKKEDGVTNANVARIWITACILLIGFMALPVEANLITGTQYTYLSTAGTPAGAGGAAESAFMNGVYTSTDISSGVLTDGYVTTQDDVNGGSAQAYYVGNGPAGVPAIYGVYAGPAIDFDLNGSYNLTGLLIGYAVKKAHGVCSPENVGIAVNGGPLLQTFSAFDNSDDINPNGDARTCLIDLTPLNLTGVQSVQLSFPNSSEWTGLNEIQFYNVPEPATLGLILVSGLAMVRRRQ